MIENGDKGELDLLLATGLREPTGAIVVDKSVDVGEFTRERNRWLRKATRGRAAS